jgi:RNA polymerase-binding transcription factor DksA
VDPNHARELLARERRRVERPLAGLRHASDEGLAQRLREELAAIERAERHIEDGTYGTSVESGRPIPDERLEAVPWAERTAEEQKRSDRRSPD